MRFKPVRWDGAIALLCYFCAFWVLASPLVPYMFTMTQLYLGTVVLGTLLAGIGVWLNHRVEKENTKT
ncbi:MAG: hypothetical protein ACYDAG_11015 [Chloroflexota bacterium]